MIIRFRQGATARVNFRAGDELHVATLTPELETLLAARRLDNQAVCEVVRAGYDTSDPTAEDEHAVVGRSRRRAG
jgi:hypothetical protein